MSHDPCVAWVGYFDTWTKDDPTLEKFWVAVVGFHRWTCARAMLRLEVLMSLRDVWLRINSVRPPFGSQVGHKDCPHWGASLQATLEVVAGLTELSAPQTSPKRHLPLKRMRHEHMVCNIFFSKRQDFRPPKLYNPRIHIGERYWPIGCCTCVYFITFHGGIDPWIAAFLPGPDSPKVVIRP